MGVIYVRPNLINGKKYVGQAKDLEVRQCDWMCLSQPYAGTLINRAREKYGIDAFGFEILKECNDDELDYWEKYYIKELNTKAPYGYNLTDGGDGCKGYHHTEEAKKKMSEKRKGENNGFYGKHHLEETKEKNRQAHLGKKHSKEAIRKTTEKNKGKKRPPRSEEWKNKLSETLKGRTPWNKGKTNIYSEESKRKMSESQKGEKHWNYGKHLSEEWKIKIGEANKGKYKGVYNTKCSKTVFQYDLDGNFIKEWQSVAEAQRQLNINHISMCCLNKRKTCGGFIWRYKESAA